MLSLFQINSQAVDLGIERPRIRNGLAVANLNTLIYILINLRMLQRIRRHKAEQQREASAQAAAAYLMLFMSPPG